MVEKRLPSTVSLECRISKHAARERRKATTRRAGAAKGDNAPRSSCASRSRASLSPDSEPPAASPESCHLRSRAAALLAPLGHRRRRRRRRRGAPPPPDASLQVQRLGHPRRLPSRHTHPYVGTRAGTHAGACWLRGPPQLIGRPPRAAPRLGPQPLCLPGSPGDPV